MKVLHICNWYPEDHLPHRAIFIKRQIDSLDKYCTNDIIHFEIQKGSFFKTQFISSNKFKRLLIKLPFKVWLINEIISLIWLYYFLVLKKNQNKYDVINFHIAYPLLSFWHLIKKKINCPVVISEHWSAYHFNFNLSKELPRIQRIFRQGIPLITVSKSLSEDIKLFSGAEIKSYIIPNTVDPEVFYKVEMARKKHFLMAGSWKYPKKPFLVMEAFSNFCYSNSDWELIIIGEGPLFPEMKEWVKRKKFGERIKLLGKMNSKEIAQHMRSSRAFLHASEYETFSVVCAEAISTGLPVLASNVGGIPEVVKDNGVLISNDLNSWKNGIENIRNFEIKQTESIHQFAPVLIGEMYFKTLVEVIEDYQN